MRIVSAKASLFDPPGARFSLGTGFMLRQELLLVELTLENGCVGYGGTSTYSNGREILSHFEEFYVGALLGHDVFETERFWGHANHLTKLFGHPMCPAAIDLAMWDAIGKTVGQPVHKLLGADRTSIDCYLSLPAFETVEEHLEVIDAYAAEGTGAFKLHLSGEVGFDLELISRVRAGTGASVVLMVDAVGHYDYLDAVRIGRALDEHGFLWFEMPMEDFYREPTRRLNRTIATPVTSGEVSISALSEAFSAITSGRWDIIRADAANWGGITQGRKITALADASGFPCELHSWGFAPNQFGNLHLMLACSKSRYFERAFPDERFAFGFQPLRFEGGKVIAPELPGLGMVPDPEVLQSALSESRTWQ